MVIHMKVFLYRLVQWTWGILQTLIGALLYLINRKNPHFKYHGAIATVWHGHSGSVSLGMFVFLEINHEKAETPQEQKLLRHEYGHTIQSLILGPLYLLIIGLPSLIWAGCFNKYRAKRSVSYDRFYPEHWANRLGAKIAKEKRRKTASPGEDHCSPQT